MRSRVALLKRLGVAVSLLLCVMPVWADDTAQPPEPSYVTLHIGNRMYPDFGEVVKTAMHERHQIGDSEYFFEVVGFYPHFAIIDSTKQVTTLSLEPKNPAFQINVFEADTLQDKAWAFYSIKVPHFSPKSYMTFEVKSFEYRGEIFGEDADGTRDGGTGEKPAATREEDAEQ